MHIFITGATGFIGHSLIRNLLAHKHTVLALARTDASATSLLALGPAGSITIHHGSLTDLDSLTAGARAADAVVHLAFIHDFSDFAGACKTDREAIQALADGLAPEGGSTGGNKPLVIASGTLMVPKGVLANEDTPAERDNPPFSDRAFSADLLFKLSSERGIRGCAVRLSPTVHGAGDKGMIPGIIGAAKKAGYVPIPEGGMSNVWPAVALEDAAELLRLVVEKGRAGRIYNAVGEMPGVKMDEVLRLISERAGVPVKTVEGAKGMSEGLGFYGHVVGLDNPTSSEKTREELGWAVKGKGLIEDMEENYF